MKVVALREAKQKLSATVDESQEQRVLITRYGKPAAILIGVEGEELEDILLRSNPRFWEMIEASRSDPRRLSLAEVRSRYKAAGRSQKKRKKKK